MALSAQQQLLVSSSSMHWALPWDAYQLSFQHICSMQYNVTLLGLCARRERPAQRHAQRSAAEERSLTVRRAAVTRGRGRSAHLSDPVAVLSLVLRCLSLWPFTCLPLGPGGVKSPKAVPLVIVAFVSVLTGPQSRLLWLWWRQ